MTVGEGDDAARWLGEREKLIEDALAGLVNINSFTENVEGGRAVAASLEQLFAHPELHLERRASTRFADHLTWTSTGAGAEGVAPLALIGHLDTVFPPGTFEGYRRDGDLARGPGVLDMKGGLVVVAWALKAIAESVGLGNIAPLRIVIVADEEVGSPEGQGIIGSVVRDATSALVFEAGRVTDAIITRRRGTGALTVTARGKAAHAGNNHKDGANAIRTLARFVDRAEGLTDYTKGVSVNVGIIRGGESKNTVPDFAEAKLDLRFETRVDADRLLENLRAVALDVALPGTTLELEGGVLRSPLERTEKSVSLMQAYGEAARLSGLGSDEAGLIGGGSDASTSHALGIASIDGLGPRGVGFHTKDEQITLKTLLLRAQALARFLVVANRRNK